MTSFVDAYALIIDDNHLNIDVLQLLLTQHGVWSAAVDTPRQLDAQMNAMPQIDIVFLDLEFPNANGFDLLPMLRADARLAKAAFVAYSVHTSEIDHARRAGFDSFIGKPLDQQRFSAQLRRILARQPVWEA